MFLAHPGGRSYSGTARESHSGVCVKMHGLEGIKMSAISRRHFIGTAAAASAIPLIGSTAHAQADWPTKPIKIIAGYPAGGQTDLYARTYGEHIRSETGQNVTVENKAGASGSVAAGGNQRAGPPRPPPKFSNSTTRIIKTGGVQRNPPHPPKEF